MGKAVAGDGLRLSDGAVEDRLRRMLEAADKTGAAVPDLPAELGESLSVGGTKDAGDGTGGADGVAGSGASGGSGGEPGQLVGAGQGILGDEAPGTDPPRAQDLGDSGGRGESAGAQHGEQPRDLD